ncbi:SRPBCC domain-containing protein [Antrihabitans cavernicola]|uniref:Polyketide cyclase n=1 Tax=Antrihabitans cavernicola TaxID=2495913 RepID=A0A5A7S8E6_9NOCA|nr:SRPBCC domain-containing protein [Spelaeibacter cavernicola]KAA0021754.1 polyketide cyclase [Spelaeibacter cavernicola]
MEYGKIERTMYVDATPDVVFEVVSSPEHLKEWWPDDVAGLESPVPGASGELKWGDCDAGGQAVAITVVDAQPPRLFSFRWTQPIGETAAVGNSMLVVFELTATGEGTTVRMTETGFREMGWEVAVLEEQYNSHVEGWDRFLPRLVEYAGQVSARR